MKFSRGRFALMAGSLALAACGEEKAVSAGVEGATVGMTEAQSEPAGASEGTGDVELVAECGNGFVEGSEECDDGNASDEDDCTTACEVPCGIEWMALQPTPSQFASNSADAVVRTADGRVFVARTVAEREHVAEQDVPVLIEERFSIDAFDPAGTMMWQAHFSNVVNRFDPIELGRDGLGTLYVLGTNLLLNLGDPVMELRAFDESDGRELWRRELTGVQVYPWAKFVFADDGSLIATSVVSDDAGSTLHASKYEALTGEPLWTAKWQREGKISDSGAAAVGPDGSIFIYVSEWVDETSTISTVLRVGPDGGELEPIYTTSRQDFPTQVLDLVIDRDGFAVLVYNHLSERFVERVDLTAGISLWTLDAEDFAELGQPRRQVAVNDVGDIYLVGTRSAEGIPDKAWYQRFSSDGERLCSYVFGAVEQGLATPAFEAEGLATSEGPEVAITGVQIEGIERSAWVASLRGR